MTKKAIKKPKVGRPSVEVKKKPFQVMLDPRYIDHFKEVALKKKIQPQELARMVLTAIVPDPYNAPVVSIDVIQNLLASGRK